ncbi:MAG: Hpt domain-containing protein [Telluria sp.]
MASPVDQEFFAKLRALNDKFGASLPATLGRLREARLACDPAAPDQVRLAEMHEVLHTLAGSAATFGFRALGQQARALEQRLRALLAGGAAPAAAWSEWLAGVDQYLAWAERDPKAAYYDGE